jgi:hypothetical protein
MIRNLLSVSLAACELDSSSETINIFVYLISLNYIFQKVHLEFDIVANTLKTDVHANNTLKNFSSYLTENTADK